jgi:high-affinity Fe2+/Pb2+ permease
MSEPAQHDTGYTAPPAEEIHSGSLMTQWVSSIHRRYRDAYAVALSIIAQGERLKITALIVWVLLSVLFFVISLAAMKENGAAILGGLIMGVLIGGFVGAVIYGYGMRLAAEGQQLLASLDVAVNTSQFLANQDRATIMNL